MKRSVSACLQQTQRFESEADCQSYLRTLQRKHIKHKLLEKGTEQDGSVFIRILREYNGYPIGDYFEPDR